MKRALKYAALALVWLAIVGIIAALALYVSTAGISQPPACLATVRAFLGE